MDIDMTTRTNATGTDRPYERRSATQAALEAHERQRVLEELAELLRTNPFLVAEV